MENINPEKREAALDELESRTRKIIPETVELVRSLSPNFDKFLKKVWDIPQSYYPAWWLHACLAQGIIDGIHGMLGGNQGPEKRNILGVDGLSSSNVTSYMATSATRSTA